MNDIITERSGNILRIQLNRPGFHQNEREGESKSTSGLTNSKMSVFENLRKG